MTKWHKTIIFIDNNEILFIQLWKEDEQNASLIYILYNSIPNRSMTSTIIKQLYQNMEQWNSCIITNLKLNKRCCYEIHEHSLLQLGKSNEMSLTIDTNFAYSSFRTTNQLIKTHSMTLLTCIYLIL